MFLKLFEGEWTVERNFYPPGGGPVNRATGECTQKMVQLIHQQFNQDAPARSTC